MAIHATLTNNKFNKSRWCSYILPKERRKAKGLKYLKEQPSEHSQRSLFQTILVEFANKNKCLTKEPTIQEQTLWNHKNKMRYAG